MKAKKFLNILLSAAVSVSVLAGCSSGSETQSGQSTDGGAEASASSQTEDDYVLKIAYNNSLCEAPIQMGVDKGFFEAEGLKFEMVKVDAAHMPEAIGSGQVDAGFGLLGKYLQPMDNGLDIKITSGIHTGCTKVLVPADSDIKTVEDLKGKRVGTTGLGAAAPTIITRRSLYHAGLKAGADDCDVEFVVFGASDLAQALENGAVDAIANGDPQASIAQKEYNLRPIIDTATDDEYKDEYCCISFVTGDIAKNHPEIAKKFTTAVMKASQYVENNKQEVAQIQVDNEWVSGDPEFNASVLENYNYKPDLDGGYNALKITVPDLQAIGLISADTNADEFIENSVLRFDDLTNEDILGSGTDDTEQETQQSAKADAGIPNAYVSLYNLPDCCN